MFLLSRHAVLIEEVPVGYRKVAALQLEASGMATGCPLSALRLSRRHRTGVQWGPRVPSHKGLSHGGSHHGYPTEGVTRKQEADMATGCPLSALRLSRRHRTGVQWGPRVPSHKGLSHGGSHHGYPTEGVTKDNGGGGGEGGGGDTVSVRQADRLGSRGQNVETSISGSCWCGGHEAQRTSRQRPPTIVAGAERRQSLRRLHVAHPVLDHGVGCLAVAGMVGRRRAGGAPTPALEAR